MKIGKLILIALVFSAYATVSVINIQLAKPKYVAEVTVDMLDVMSRAFDEGGETTCPALTQEEVEESPTAMSAWCGNPGTNWCVIRWYLPNDPFPVDTYMIENATDEICHLTQIICLPDVN